MSQLCSDFTSYFSQSTFFAKCFNFFPEESKTKMNLKAVDTNCANSTDVDDIRKKIESALGNVEEIVKNNAVISVATSVEDSKNDIQANIRDDDEIVVYVSIKINKQEPLAIKSTSLHNGVLHNGIDNNHEDHHNGVDDRNAGVKRVNMMQQDSSATEVTGRAIRPRARGRGGAAGSSVTAPTTPVRGARSVRSMMRSKSQEQNQSKSLEVSSHDFVGFKKKDPNRKFY